MRTSALLFRKHLAFMCLKKNSVTKNDDGVTLVEVIVATVLLAVVALGVLPVFFNTMQLSADQELRSHAINTVSMVSENIRQGNNSQCHRLLERINTYNNTTYQDSRQKQYRVTIENSTCPTAGTSGAVDLRITATHNDRQIAFTETKIFVSP